MTSKANKKKIEDLVEYLNDCNHSYYVLNDPKISDYEFDMKMKELEALEAEIASRDEVLATGNAQCNCCPTRRKW